MKKTDTTDSIGWARESSGQFSGLDYSKRHSANGIEPYFVWADVNGFAQLRKPGKSQPIPEYLPILLQLAAGRSPHELLEPGLKANGKDVLFIEPAYLSGSNYTQGSAIPALVTKEFFSVYQSNPQWKKLVIRFELDIPQATLPNIKPAGSGVSQRGFSSAEASNSVEARSLASASLDGDVVAFIDDGCAFAHARFRSGDPAQINSLNLRVKRYWDMNERADSSPHIPPSLFAGELFPGENGRAFTDVDLKNLISEHVVGGQINEDELYRSLATGTRYGINRLAKPWAHGVHVMDLACGPYFAEDRMSTRTNAAAENPDWAAAQDAASEAPVIFVQLPMRTVQDTTLRGTMQQDVIKALDYILSQCSDTAKIVVNLSWGTLAGPHTGANLLEREIDLRIAASAGRLKVVVPAGNGRQSRTHAQFALAPLNDPQGRDSIALNWRNQPDDSTESYLELWFEDGVELEIDIQTPGGQSLGTVRRGDVKFLDYTGFVNWPVAQPDVILGAVYSDSLASSAQLGPGHGIVLALAPTFSRDGIRAVAPHGIWQVTVRNVSAMPAVIDGYIERDDTAADTRKGARQSYFDDPNYDYLAADDDEKVADSSDPAATYVRREGGFNSIGTGFATQKVGGVRKSDLHIADYSPDHHYSNRVQRAGTLIAREKANGNTMIYACCEESLTLRGIRAAGTRSGGTVRLIGTSLAAPQVVRDLVNGWAPEDLHA